MPKDPRFNQTLSRCLTKIVSEDQTDWDDTVLMGYRASRQASTKQSPYYMFFQQNMRLPIDAELQGSTTNAEVPQDDDIEQTVAALLKSREVAFEKAKENISKAQKAQKETYDRKHVQSELPLGTKVWLENTAQKQRKGGKMDRKHYDSNDIFSDLRRKRQQLKRAIPRALRSQQAKRAIPPALRSQQAKRATPPALPPQKEIAPVHQPAAKKTKTGNTWVTINKTRISNDDKDILLTGKWLNDVHIHAAHELLKKDCDLGGMQSTVRG